MHNSHMVLGKENHTLKHNVLDLREEFEDKMKELGHIVRAERRILVKTTV